MSLPLPPFWPERSAAGILARRVSREPCPPFKTALAEAEAIERAIAVGAPVVLPGYGPGGPSTAVYAGLRQGAAPYLGQPGLDPHLPGHWQQLPSITRFLLPIANVERRKEAPAHYEALMSAIVEHLHALSVWQHYGRRVYVLDRETYELLIRTDLPDIPTSLLSFPLPSFYIRLPEGVGPLLQHRTGTVARGEGILVDVNACEGTSHRRNLWMFVGLEAGLDPDVEWEMCVRSRLAFESVETIRALGDRLDEGVRTVRPRPEDQVEYDVAEQASLPRLVLALCCYLQSQHTEVAWVPPAPRPNVATVRNPAKLRKRQQQAARMSALGYWRVGVPLDERSASDREAIPDAVSADDVMSARRRVKTRFWVRGHYRLQPQATRESGAARFTWVRPHQRGPDFGTAMRLQAGKVPRPKGG